MTAYQVAILHNKIYQQIITMDINGYKKKRTLYHLQVLTPES